MTVNEPSTTRSAPIVLAVVLGVYAVAFVLPVTDAGTPQAMYGFQAFFLGLVSIVYVPMWLANPALWIGCYYYRSGRWSAARNAGLLAALLAVSEVWFWDDRPEAGYYVWLASMLLLAAAGAVQAYKQAAPQAATQ